MSRSFRTRLIFSFIGLAIGPVLITAAVLTWKSYEALKNEALDHRHADAERVATVVEDYINELTNLLELTTQAHGFKSLSLPDQRNILEEVLSFENRYEELTLLDYSGQEIIRVNRINVIFPKDLKNRESDPGFYKPKNSGHNYFSPVYFHPVSGEPYMQISIPLTSFSTDDTDFVLIGTVRLKKIWNLLAAKMHVKETVIITDASGRIVGHPDPSVSLKGVRFNLDQDFQGIGTDLKGNQVVLSRIPLIFGEQKLSVIAYQPVETALFFAQSIVYISLIVAVIALIVAILLAFLVVGNIVKPLNRLSAVARSIQKGDLSQKADIGQTDEVGELGKAFNDMTFRLHDTIHNLENEVQKRQHEIEERKKTESEKAELEQQLRQTHKMEAIGTMAGGIAHDFNNILAAILGYTELLKLDSSLSESAMSKVSQIYIAGTRAKNLVSHILSFSRMSLLKTNFEPISLSEIVNEVITFQRSVIPSCINLTHEVAYENCHIKGDATQIHQILINLITNATHAMEEHGGTLSVTLKPSQSFDNSMCENFSVAPGNYVTFSVSDTGCGIPEDVMERIFDPYFTTKDVGKGSGMGLSVVHGLVENHGGSIHVASQAGKGTTFTLAFPAIDVVSKKAAFSADETVPEGSEFIVYVDDEPSITDAVKSSLETLGYRVMTFNDPLEARDYYLNHSDSIDLVITDQTMPKLTGANLAAEILAHCPDMPIILLTGYSSVIDETTSRKLGIAGYAFKPVKREKLARLIRTVLDQDTTGD